MADRIWGFGTEGRLGERAIASLADSAEEHGFSSFWINSTRRQDDPVDVLRQAGDATSSIEIALGVVSLDTFAADQLAPRLQFGADSPRVLFGVGAGARRPGGLDLVQAGLRTLRRHQPDAVRIAVGGQGPRMMELAGRSADALCLSMMSPEAATEAVARFTRAAEGVGRATPPVYLYHRVALGPEAESRLRAETRAYAAPTPGGTVSSAAPTPGGAVSSAAPTAAGADPSNDRVLGTVLGGAGELERDAGELERDLARFPPECIVVFRPVLEDPRDVSQWLGSIQDIAALVLSKA